MPIEIIDQMSEDSSIKSEKLEDDSEDKSPTREEPPKEKAKDEVVPVVEEEIKEEIAKESKKQPELKIDTKLVEEESNLCPLFSVWAAWLEVPFSFSPYKHRGNQ